MVRLRTNWRRVFTSDYFDQLYRFALKLIDDGKAYIDDQSSDDIASQKGTPMEPGTNSPYRDRSPEENRALFERMKGGELPEGACVLRAKIDMSNPNMHMRIPSCIGLSTLLITEQVISGVFILCTTLLMANLIA